MLNECVSILRSVLLLMCASVALAAPVDQARYIEHVQKGYAFALTGMKDQAIAEFEQALTLSPDEYDLHHRLGTLYGCPKGVEHLRESIRLEPSHWDAYSDLGMCLIQQGQVQKGRALVDKALELNPRNAQIRYQVGKWNLEDKDFPKAAENFEAALDVDGDYFDAAHELGMTRMQMKEFQAAERAFKRAIAIMPNHPGPYIHVAPALRALKQETAACINLEAGARLSMDLQSSPSMQEALTGLKEYCPKSRAIPQLESTLKQSG
jgi:tetratricopeptide (TPR) repeat protein